MSRCTAPKAALIWSTVVKTLPDEQMKFALNGAVDILPYKANLHLWKKRKDPSCPLCNHNQYLLHVLNNCTVARDLRRYNICHDAVLQEIAVAIRSYIPTTSVLMTDIDEGYAFPLHIIPSDLRPDIVWWDENSRSLCLAELIVCFESNFEDAVLRKSAKYLDLADQAELNGYHTTLLTLQVGSCGVPDYTSLSRLSYIIGYVSERPFKAGH